MSELRRSLRLQESGYYKPDGTPVISYKERLYRVFKRRRYQRSQPSLHSEDFQKPAPAPGPCEAHLIVARPWFILQALVLSFIVVYSIMSERDQWTLSSRADRMPNFALQSVGATVVRSRSSQTYHPGGFSEIIKFWWYSKHKLVLQPGSPLVPGRCWPFAGDRGHLHIELANPVHVTHVTLGHIAKFQSPTGETSSAPKYFSVYGMTELDGKDTFLGKFFYDENEPSFQTFALCNKGVFKHIRVQVENNWGNTEYTCLYNFRVHGRLSRPAESPELNHSSPPTPTL